MTALGTTTRQMLGAPRRAIFIWCNDRLDYPRQLARDLRRTDLQIVCPDFDPLRFAGKKLTGIVVDHATHLSAELAERVNYLKARIR